MNTGERDELLAKLALIRWREDKLHGIDHAGDTPRIYGVGGGGEYIRHSKTITELKTMSDIQIRNLCKDCCVDKASPSQKADVYINGIGCSLKSKRGALPALINHTHRYGILNVCQQERIDIKRLDVLVNNYWLARVSGRISEDVEFKGSVFANDRDVMVRLLAYFLFKGTASGNSERPAKRLCSFTDPLDYSTWTFYDDPLKAAENIIDNAIISLRSKGIPETYRPDSQKPEHIEMRPWIHFSEGKWKGAIHIRG